MPLLQSLTKMPGKGKGQKALAAAADPRGKRDREVGTTSGDKRKKPKPMPQKVAARSSGPVSNLKAGKAKHSKLKTVETDTDESEDEEESESEESGDTSGGEESLEEASDGDLDGTEVDVTLEFFDPRESDFHGLKALLQNFLDGRSFAASELVDTIIQQSSVGTVVKAGEEEDPIGVLSVLSTHRYRQLTCLTEIRRYILQHCPDGQRATLEKAWDGPSTGLIINERLINCPPQLGPPLVQALFEEIGWAKEDEPTQELRDSFRLGQYIAISRVFAEPAPHKAGKSKKQKVAEEPQFVFVRPEDEFFHKHCTDSFSFVTADSSTKDDLQARRLVMLLNEGDVAKARAELDEVVGNPAASSQ